MNTTTIKRGVIYCRVSSKDQVEGTSLETQERLCLEYAERNNIEIVQIFTDKGESAKTADRKEFIAAIKLCAQKKMAINCFIVYKLDRFARNQEDHVSVRAMLKRYGAELRSVTEPINDSTIGKAMEGILSVFAEFDNNVRAERCKNGMLERIKQGVWVWQAPIGYYRPTQGSNLVPEPKTADYIRLAFEEYSKGIYTYKSLAEFLAQRGFVTRTGKKPFMQLMEHILKNPIYCGIMEVWGECCRGKFEPIISERLFDKCQAIASGKSVHAEPRRANNPLFPLRKLVVCAACREALTGSSSTGRKGQKYPYYHHPHQDCSQADFIPKETFEQLFVEYLGGITPNIEYEKAFKDLVVLIWKENFLDGEARNAVVNKELSSLTREQEHVYESHRTGVYGDAEFREQRNLVERRIMEKRRLLQDVWIEERDMNKALEYCFDYVRNTAKVWAEADYHTRLRFQKRIFKSEIPFDVKDGFGTANLTLVYKLFRENAGKNSELVRLFDEIRTFFEQN